MIRYYILNIVLICIFLLTVVSTFYVKFKVDDIKQQIAHTEKKILEHKRNISLLEIEWSYLTRPERMRVLSKKHFKDLGPTSLNQIKTYSQLKVECLSRLNNYNNRQIVMNE